MRYTIFEIFCGDIMLKKKVEYTEDCPECGSKSLSRDYERAEIVCNECGLVVDENLIDEGPEWRAFDYEQMLKRSRTGAPMTYLVHDKGLSTVLDWRNKDGYGKDIPPRKRAQLYRLRKWQQQIRVSNPKERNLTLALMELSKLTSRLALPRSIREAAAVIYRKAVEKSLIRGRSIEGVCVASLYAACRQCKVPRTLHEIAIASRQNRKEIGRTYRFISRKLNINTKAPTPLDYVPRLGSKLALSGRVQSKATEILKKAMDQELTVGQVPIGISAAALYIASVLLGEKRTQKEVADAANVTEVTIRNRYKKLAEKLYVEVDM